MTHFCFLPFMLNYFIRSKHTGASGTLSVEYIPT